MEKVHVVLADDHVLVRAGIRNALSKFRYIEIVGEAENGPALCAILAETHPHLLLIDVAMPGFDPLTKIDQIHRAYPDMKILVVSAYDDDVYVEGLLGVGVDGYHLKSDSLKDLRLAIDQVLAGERWISSSLITKLVGGVVRRPPAITPRQAELLHLLQQGLDNSTIARRLGLSVKTVENHLTRLYKQMGVQSRAEAITHLFQHPDLLGDSWPTEPKEPASDSDWPEGIRILLVDDSVRYRRQMRLMIGRVSPGALVWEAESSIEAFRLTEQSTPQVIFLDVILGDENGIQCVKRLHTLSPKAQIILISAYPDREFHRLGLESGAVAFVDKKDLDATALRHIIENVTV